MAEDNPEPEPNCAQAALELLFDAEEDSVQTSDLYDAGEYRITTSMLSEADRTALSSLGFDIQSIHSHADLVEDSEETDAEAHLAFKVQDRRKN